MRPEDLIVIQDQVQDAIESNLMVHRGLLPLDVALQIPNLISLKNEVSKCSLDIVYSNMVYYFVNKSVL